MSAIIPAAIGADADVPVCSFVHIPLRSVVTIFADVNPPKEFLNKLLQKNIPEE